MTKSIFVSLLLLLSLTANAIPAKKGIVRTFTIDNNHFSLSLRGDEFGSWWETDNGRKAVCNADGTARFLSIEEEAELKARASERRVQRDAQRVERMAKSRALGKFGSYIGEKRGLVILVNFKNLEMLENSTQEEFDAMFNEEGYSNNNHIGSVHDYFFDQSYGLFDLKFDVVGPVTVANDYSYYGRNSNGNDVHPAEMVIEACKLVDEDVDFSVYDWDDDGEVDQVFIIYAGYGENAGGSSSTIWPHEYSLSNASYYGDGDGAQVFDDTKVDTYAVSCELAGRKGKTMNGIGIACHEFSHCLGYPDFYDVNYSGNYGMNIWDLLDTGGYCGPGNNGEVPTGYSAYERWMAGWLEPVELDCGMEVEALSPLNDEPQAYILYNERTENEYYLLENRAPERWFSFWLTNEATTGGLLVTHVDYSRSAWNRNEVNTSRARQRMTIIAANDKYQGSSAKTYAEQLYPNSKNNELTNTSTPAAALNVPNKDGQRLMNKPIVEITRNDDGTIAFKCKEPEEVGVPEIPWQANQSATITTIGGINLGTQAGAQGKGLYIRNGRKEIINK